MEGPGMAVVDLIRFIVVLLEETVRNNIISPFRRIYYSVELAIQP